MKRHQEIKKERMMSYFIQAVTTLSLNKPIDQITLREIADTAGYNSATLYNYFRNLDELIMLSVDKLISDVWIGSSAVPNPENSMISYLYLWLAQCERAFKVPQLFHYFLTQADKEAVYGKLSYYFECFPNEFELLDDRHKKLLHQTDFSKRNIDYLEPCVKDGWFSQKDVERVVEIGNLLFGGTLYQIMQRELNDENRIYFTGLFFECYFDLLAPIVKKDRSELMALKEQIMARIKAF